MPRVGIKSVAICRTARGTASGSRVVAGGTNPTDLHRRHCSVLVLARQLQGWQLRCQIWKGRKSRVIRRRRQRWDRLWQEETVSQMESFRCCICSAVHLCGSIVRPWVRCLYYVWILRENRDAFIFRVHVERQCSTSTIQWCWSATQASFSLCGEHVHPHSNRS